MTNKRHTKRALLAAFMALVMCCSAFLGTTFAWFTDTATTGVNIIQSGTLDIQLLDEKGQDSVEGKSLAFVKSNGSTTEEVLWEPGATYRTQGFTIKNGGNLHLKFKVVINGITTGNAKLLEVIDFYLTDDATKLENILSAGKEYNLAPNTFFNGEDGSEEAHTIYLVGHMKEEAGNEYQGLSIEGVGITLVATQLNAESDSFGPDYDIDSIYPGHSAGADLSGENGVYEEQVLTTLGTNPIIVTLPADLVGSLATGNATQNPQLAATAIEVSEVDGNTIVSYDDISLINNDGSVIDLSENTHPIEVQLYVGTAYAGKTAVVSHDGEVVATANVGDDGYITYSVTHFCEVTVEILGDGEVAPEIILPVEPEEEEVIDPKTKVQMLIGSHYYTVSYGFANSYKEYENVPGKLEADIYLPEDLLAYSMAYKNGDLAETESHSDLTIMSDLDFSRINWAPIGRFYTNIHGNNKKISNLNDSFFGCVYDCQLYNVTIENVTASGSASGVIAKELAGDVFIENVSIAGTNTVSYVNDGATNWPEGGTGVGAICGVSLIGYTGQGNVDVTVTGTITVNYNGIICRNTTNLENLGISENFGLNVYKENQNAKVTVAEGGAITTNGDAYIMVSDGIYKTTTGETVYYVYNANGLYFVANEVNKVEQYAGNIFDGKTVVLVNDIDLKDAEWTPIGNFGNSSNQFTGTFDGAGYVVSNFKVTIPSTDTKNRSSYGFFGNVDGTVKNLTVDGAQVYGVPKFAGALVGRLNGGLIDNCKVVNSAVTINNWTVGGIVSQINAGDVKNCTVENSTITGYAAVGGIVGIALDAGERTIENCAVKNCDIVSNGSFGGDYDEMFGGIIGALYSGKLTVYLNDCKVIGSTIKNKASSALYGYIEDGDKIYIDGYEMISDGLGKNGVNYLVSNAEGLATLNARFADKSAGKGVNVELLNDIDFTGKTWTTVDSHADTAFTFTSLNGNGHTISNLTVNGQAMFSRFAGTGDVTIKDVTFDNAVVNSNGKINTSILTVQSYQNVLLDNVDVKNSSISGGYKVAPLIATVYNESSSAITATLKNCDVYNTTVTATSYDFCTTGMVAFVYADDNDKIEFENCTVDSVKIYAPDDSYDAHAWIYTTGSGTLFNEAPGVTVTNCTFENK